MNSVFLRGRLTKDPEVRETSSGKKTARFTLAVDRRISGSEATDFIPVVVWEKTADLAEKYLSKGREVIVMGEIQTGSYTNKNGDKVYTTTVVGNRVEFIGGGGKPEAPKENNDTFVDAVEDEGLPWN